MNLDCFDFATSGLKRLFMWENHAKADNEPGQNAAKPRKAGWGVP